MMSLMMMGSYLMELLCRHRYSPERKRQRSRRRSIRNRSSFSRSSKTWLGSSKGMIVASRVSMVKIFRGVAGDKIFLSIMVMVVIKTHSSSGKVSSMSINIGKMGLKATQPSSINSRSRKCSPRKIAKLTLTRSNTHNTNNKTMPCSPTEPSRRPTLTTSSSCHNNSKHNLKRPLHGKERTICPLPIRHLKPKSQPTTLNIPTNLQQTTPKPIHNPPPPPTLIPPQTPPAPSHLTTNPPPPLPPFSNLNSS